jgi:hypothetical protein
VNYSVNLDGKVLSTKESIDHVQDQLLTTATQWTPKEPIFSGSPVNVKKTIKDVKKRNISGNVLDIQQGTPPLHSRVSTQQCCLPFSYLLYMYFQKMDHLSFLYM